MDNDHAVAPVVAAMLLLVAAVMFLSVYNTVIIPSFKQQAEVEHLFAVEESFLAFGSDMTTAAALKQDLHLSKRIPLGGGAMILDPARSGGTLRVGGEDTIATVTLNGTTRYCCNLTGFSYTPISNFWRDQGYVWQYGYINVTGVGGLQTPLEYADMQDVCEAAKTSGFARSLIGIDYDRQNDGHGNYNCSTVQITLVTFESDGEHTIASGNSVATLSLDVSVEEEKIVSPDRIEIAVNTSLPVPLNTSLLDNCNKILYEMNETCNNIKDCTSPHEDGWDRVTLSFNETTPDVTLRQVTVTVSAR